MAENTTLIVIGVIMVVLITAGLTYYVTKTSVSPPLTNGTNVSPGGLPTITVNGEATKTLSPDLLTIGITLESMGNDTSSSQAQSSKDTAALKAALLSAGLNSSEIQTSSYYTYAVYNDSCYDYCDPYYYEYPMDDAIVYESGGEAKSAPAGEAYADGGVAYSDIAPMPYHRCKEERNCTITGYKTVHSIMVKTGRTDMGGAIAEASVNATNASKVDYIYFSVKEETRVKVESELQASAAAAAKAKADNIAKGLGAKLGKIVSINPNYYYPYPVYAYDRSAVSAEGGAGTSAATPPTEIFPTDTTMSSYITVVYELEQ